MITKEEFLEKYPDLEAFKKEHPIGEKFKYYDRNIWEIRGYMDDEFPDGEKLTLVALRTYVKYKEGRKNITHWSYHMKELYDFYATYEFCQREFKNEEDDNNRHSKKKV